MTSKSAAGEVRPRLAEHLREFGWVRAEEDRGKVVAIHVRVGAAHRGRVVFAFARGVRRFEIHDEAGLLLPHRAVRLHRGAVRAEQIVRRERRLEVIAVTRREHAVQIAAVHHHPTARSASTTSTRGRRAR